MRAADCEPGTVVQAGRRQATAEGRIEVHATGELIAAATTGCLVLGAPPAG